MTISFYSIDMYVVVKHMARDLVAVAMDRCPVDVVPRQICRLTACEEQGEGNEYSHPRDLADELRLTQAEPARLSGMPPSRPARLIGKVKVKVKVTNQQAVRAA
jgi:hypothetical protein